MDLAVYLDLARIFLRFLRSRRIRFFLHLARILSTTLLDR